MKVILQRVLSASVEVNNQCVGKCDHGFCVLVAMEPTDTTQDIEWMAQKIAYLRIFADANDKMNLSICDIGGSILIVSQFTLLADCTTGRRPSFTAAGHPQQAERLFNQFVETIKKYNIPVQTGIFGASMLVHIENDGPATFILESPAHDTKKTTTPLF